MAWFEWEITISSTEKFQIAFLNVTGIGLSLKKKKKMLSGRQFADQVDKKSLDAIISDGEGSESSGYISDMVAFWERGEKWDSDQ